MSFTQKFLTGIRYPSEMLALLALILVLPIMEAPKNLLWAAYLLIWIVNRWRAAEWGGKWDRWDTIILVWTFSGYLIAPFAGFHHDEWAAPRDLLRYGLLLWALKRSGYGRREFEFILAAIGIACTLALGVAYWMLFFAHSRKALELNSVGHVNHSAIFLVISFGVVLSFLFAYWRRLKGIVRLVLMAVCVFIATGVIISASRAAVGVLLLSTGLSAIVWLRRSYKPLIAVSILAAVVVASLYGLNVDVVRKQERNINNNNFMAYRHQIWNQALLAWQQYPLFGVGMDNFNQISQDNVKQWLEASGKTYDAANYKSTAHAHNLFLNTLVERGISGFAIVILVLWAWLYQLIRYLPKKKDDDIAWALWGGNFAAWMGIVVIGVVNTTLHHENAMLTALLFGSWLTFTLVRKNLSRQTDVELARA